MAEKSHFKSSIGPSMPYAVGMFNVGFRKLNPTYAAEPGLYNTLAPKILLFNKQFFLQASSEKVTISYHNLSASSLVWQSPAMLLPSSSFIISNLILGSAMPIFGVIFI